MYTECEYWVEDYADKVILFNIHMTKYYNKNQKQIRKQIKMIAYCLNKNGLGYKIFKDSLQKYPSSSRYFLRNHNKLSSKSEIFYNKVLDYIDVRNNNVSSKA